MKVWLQKKQWERRMGEEGKGRVREKREEEGEEMQSFDSRQEILSSCTNVFWSGRGLLASCDFHLSCHEVA